MAERRSEPRPAGDAAVRTASATGTYSLASRARTRELSAAQVAAIRAVMQLFVEDDIANGASATQTIDCAVCMAPRPSPGFIQYDHHLLCNDCAAAYEIARARGEVMTAAEYVRGAAFGGGRRMSHVSRQAPALRLVPSS